MTLHPTAINRQDLIIVQSIHDVPWGRLSYEGVEGAGLDIDLTIARHGKLPSSEMISYLRGTAREYHLQLCLATNNRTDRTALRVLLCCQIMQPGRFLLPRKPQARYYRLLAQMMGLEPHQIVLVDDKLANVLAAIEAGMWGVLVNPLEQDSLIIDRLFLRKWEDLQLASMGRSRP